MVGLKTNSNDKHFITKKQTPKRRWTKEETDYLIMHANFQSVAQIAEKLNREEPGVAKKIERLGIKEDKPKKKVNRRRWTKKEIDYLIANTGVLTLTQIAKQLKRSVDSVESKLSRLEISCAMQPLPEPWTQEEIDYLSNHLETNTHAEIARKLGRTTISIRRKVNALGLTKSTPRWTEEEVNYLIEFVGRDSVKKMAKTLNRTEDAVQNKLNRLGIGNTKAETLYIKLTDICLAFSVSKTTVYKWIEKDGLPAKKKILRLSRKIYIVSPSSFWKWVEANQNKIDLRKYEIYSLPDEPKWLKLAIKKQYIDTPERHAVKWTNLEDVSLISFWKSGMTQKEMANRLNRTKKSVENRLKFLRTKSLLERVQTMEFTKYLYEDELALFLVLQKFAVKNNNINVLQESHKILELSVARYDLDSTSEKLELLERAGCSTVLN